jgi:hypothetical protein
MQQILNTKKIKKVSEMIEQSRASIREKKWIPHDEF